jgi:hypothetical protein
VRHVDEEDETEEDEDAGADEGDVVTPEDEEAVGDEEGERDEDEPEEDFGAPPAVGGEFSGLVGEGKRDANPFWMAARLSRVSLTPMRRALRMVWNRHSAKQMRCT